MLLNIYSFLKKGAFFICNIIRIMLLPSQRALSIDQPHVFNTSAVFRAGRDDIDPRCINTAVAENVGELGKVLFHLVKSPGEKMSEIMRKDFSRQDPGFCAERFHLAPDVRSADRFPAFCYKNTA